MKRNFEENNVLRGDDGVGRVAMDSMWVGRTTTTPDPVGGSTVIA
jgi:hypothetical protein